MFNFKSASLNDPVVREAKIQKMKSVATHVAVTAGVIGAIIVTTNVVNKKREEKNDN